MPAAEEWGRFDRMVDVFERAHAELYRRRAAAEARGCGGARAEAVAAARAERLRRSGAFRDKAWLLALALHGARPGRGGSDEIDLRERSPVGTR
jgi:hypothetical protein